LTVGHLFRASFQNMADNFYAGALRISKNHEWQKLVFSGGLVKKLEILRKMICHKFQADYRLSAFSEDTLLGLLILSLVFSGKIGSSIDEVTAELLKQDEQGHRWS